MDDITLMKNKRDLKVYRAAVVMVILSSLVIAITIALGTLNYENTAAVSNAVMGMFMDKEITDVTDAKSKGMTFYREKNEDFDATKDEPISAFKYYYLDDSGKKVYLKNGIYYPPEYYFEDSDVQPTQVYLGFYLTAMEGLGVAKNVIRVITALLSLVIIAFFVYLWYLSWCRRQELQKEMEKAYLEQKRSIENYLSEPSVSKKKQKKSKYRR